jgi:hypothetical protein
VPWRPSPTKGSVRLSAILGRLRATPRYTRARQEQVKRSPRRRQNTA